MVTNLFDEVDEKYVYYCKKCGEAVYIYDSHKCEPNKRKTTNGVRKQKPVPGEE